MKLHEYQSMELFREYGIPTLEQYIVSGPDAAGDAARAAANLGCPVVVKAQVLTGGRGKAGGVKPAASPDDARDRAAEILKLEINGFPVEKVLVTRASRIDREYYLGFILDRSTRSVVLMMSAAGGMEIEDLARTDPHKIVKHPVDPDRGVGDASVRKAIHSVFGNADPDTSDTANPAGQTITAQAEDMVARLYRLFLEKDCSLTEINPCALSGSRLIALDAKIVIDDNALYKHPELESMKNPEEYSPDEIDARENGLSFVSLDGEIGCIVNGAGLAMATLDIIKLYGGNPANFLDVGGSSNPEKVYHALRIILKNPRVTAILINIFGGITRCDDIATGILMAMDSIDIRVPMVIRLIGTNDAEGREILASRGVTVADRLGDAVEKVVSV
jgi:succinyl-CoA synthetase beta subunit